MKHILSLAAALALSACATTSAPGSPIRSDGLATMGRPTRVGAQVVTPQQVVEDRRCPINARCVWAGRAVVRTQVVGPGWRETRNLALGERVDTHGTTLTLTSLEPGKVAGAQPPFERQTFGFEGGR